MVLMFQVEIFLSVTLSSVVVGYQHSRGPCCLHLQGEDGGNMDLVSVGIPPLQYYMATQPRSP